jgi:hypothetical protein
MTLTNTQIGRLRSLENSHGQITPSQVVRDAKDKRSPLHVLFDWNAKRAAEKHWLWRAREIIGAVTVVVTNETTTIRSPVYVHIPSAKGQGYQTVATLRQKPGQARDSLVYTLEMAAGHVRRALDLAAPLGLQDQIHALLDEIVGVQLVVKRVA